MSTALPAASPPLRSGTEPAFRSGTEPASRSGTEPGLRADLAEVAGRARPVVLAGDRVLPVLSALRPLLSEGGLRRGSVVAVDTSTSLALAVVAAASAAGSWCAAVAVGRPSLHPEAAAELGVVLERFPLISALPGSGAGGWPWVVAAVLDAVDVVVAWLPGHLRAADARRLVARGRDRGAVLVVAGPTRGCWTEAVDVRLTVVASAWEGIGDGHGRLLARRVEVAATGRGAAARERRTVLWLPASGGGVAGGGVAGGGVVGGGAAGGETAASSVTAVWSRGG